jgi:hypothetical protein
MVYRGTIRSGRVVLPADVTLPEGTEVLVALPDRRAESEAGSAIREKAPGLGRRPATSQPEPAAQSGPYADHPSRRGGPGEELRDYPVADFLSPTEYAWDGDVYAAEEAVRAYLDDSHADD